MGTENTPAAIIADTGVFHVNMENIRGKVLQKHGGIDPLPNQMAGIEIKSKGRMTIHLFQQPLGRVVVKGNLRRMNLKGKFDIFPLEFIQNRGPEGNNPIVALLDHLFCGLGERVEKLPDGGTQKSCHNGNAQIVTGRRHLHHKVNGPLSNFFWFASKPGRGKVIQTRVIEIPYTLSCQSSADSPHLQAMAVEDLQPLLAILLAGGRFLDAQYRLAYRDFQPVKSQAACEFTKFLQWQISPLAGRQCNWSIHSSAPFY